MTTDLIAELARVDAAISDGSCEGLTAAERGLIQRAVEKTARGLEAAAAALAAADAAASDRSDGSVAASIAGDLGVTAGEARRRIEVGRRRHTPAGRALAEGRITGSQERVIAAAVAELPRNAPEEAREAFSKDLTDLATGGASPTTLRKAAERQLAKADPGRLDRLEEEQQRRRDLRAGGPDTRGLSSVGITCEPRLRALLDAIFAKFAGPGQCIDAPADPVTGEKVPPEDLAKSDTRTAGQRRYDALCEILARGLAADPSSARGVASIVVRLTPEQMDEIARDGGGLVETSAGTTMTARQAVSLAGSRSWFVSALRDGREELRRIDIDKGRNGRLATAIQRLVLYAAYGGCTFPGCDHPAAKCQAHHVEEHSRGGPTTVANMGLACPVHHGWVGHRIDQWRTIPDPARPGMPRWIPPGTPSPVAPEWAA